MACSKQQSKNLIDPGVIKNGVYHNKYLEFSLRKPDNWHIRIQNTSKSRTKKNSNNSHDHDHDHNTSSTKLEYPEKVYLFSWYEKKSKSISHTGFRSNILGIAERITGSSGITSSEQYLLSIKMLMKKSAVSYNFSPNIKSLKLGERDFSILDVQASIAGQTIKVRYYTHINKGYAFSMIVSWQNQGQLTIIQRALSGLKFTK